MREVLQRLAPDVEHGVGRLERVAQRAGLLGVELLGLLAVLGGGEVEVAGNAHQLVGRDGRARPAPAVGDVGLDRAEVAAAVEDHGERLAQRQPHDAQRDRCRCVGVDQRSAEQLVGRVLVHADLLDGVIGSCDRHVYRFHGGTNGYSRSEHEGDLQAHRAGHRHRLGARLQADLRFVWTKIDDEDPPKGTTQDAPWVKILAAAALQGMIFKTTRVVVDRYGAVGWNYLTGSWPGEKRPDPDE